MNLAMVYAYATRKFWYIKSIYAQLLEKHRSLSELNPEFMKSFFILKYRLYNLKMNML